LSGLRLGLDPDGTIPLPLPSHQRPLSRLHKQDRRRHRHWHPGPCVQGRRL